MKTQKSFWYIFFVVMVFAAILYLLLIDSKVWEDEAYTMVMIRHSYSEIWRITAADVHPPLYYFILKTLICPFGYTITAAKAVSVSAYLFILAFGGIQLKKLFGGGENGHTVYAAVFHVSFCP